MQLTDQEKAALWDQLESGRIAVGRIGLGPLGLFFASTSVQRGADDYECIDATGRTAAIAVTRLMEALIVDQQLNSGDTNHEETRKLNPGRLSTTNPGTKRKS